MRRISGRHLPFEKPESHSLPFKFLYSGAFELLSEWLDCQPRNEPSFYPHSFGARGTRSIICYYSLRCCDLSHGVIEILLAIPRTCSNVEVTAELFHRGIPLAFRRLEALVEFLGMRQKPFGSSITRKADTVGQESPIGCVSGRARTREHCGDFCG